MNNITIGLFGTCGSSKWREPFIKKYKEASRKNIDDLLIEKLSLIIGIITIYVSPSDSYAS